MRVCQFRHFGTACTPAACCPALQVVSIQSFKRHGMCQSRDAWLTLGRLHGWHSQTGHTGFFLLGWICSSVNLVDGGSSSAQAHRRNTPANLMIEPSKNPPQPSAAEIPEDLALEIRKLAHDLSNALEVIVQTSYLLGTVEMKEPGGDWLRMLDNGVRKALDINLALRSYVKAHTPR